MAGQRAHWQGHLPKAPQLNLPCGVYTGKHIGAPVPEIEHFFSCPLCSEPVDMRDFEIVFAHETPLPHPKEKSPPGWRRPTAA
jgi:hypothetical protein